MFHNAYLMQDMPVSMPQVRSLANTGDSVVGPAPDSIIIDIRDVPSAASALQASRIQNSEWSRSTIGTSAAHALNGG